MTTRCRTVLNTVSCREPAAMRVVNERQDFIVVATLTIKLG